jgi:aminopeptidase N
MMKIFRLVALFLITTISFSQNIFSEKEYIANSEKSSAAKLMNLAVNPNTQNYDVIYHKLEFTVDPALYFITGQVTTTYTALTDNMLSVTFDMANELTVTSVTKNGVSLAFSESGYNELIITLPSPQQIGTSATVKINYSGVPPVNGFASFASETHNGTPVLWTLSEPYGARDWWPCKQDLNDKIDTIDVYITAPSQYISVSNGVEPEAPVINGTQKTTHFHHSYPIPAYLICMAVTNYDVYTQLPTAATPTITYPIVNYIYPETNTFAVRNQLAKTPEILGYFSTLFEPYPYSNEKYGHAQFGWGGGMEHTTVSFMQNFSRGLIAHEMAHQWFGDKITCGTWKDIWLNEGFATYLASLVIEHFDGQTAFIADKTSMINNITSSLNGAVYLTDEQALDVNRVFSGRLTYNKGAMVLNMLRFKLGDAIFFQGIKNYLADVNFAYKYAITSDLQTHLEAVYGSSLAEFFNDWIYNQGYPKYTITVQNIATGQVRITVNQTTTDTSVPFFEMPVPIRLTGVGTLSQDVVVDNTFNGEQFTVSVPFSVTGVQFDPKKDIISKLSTATLDISDFNFYQSIQIYPNPTSRTLSIDLPEGIVIESAIFHTVLGQKIMETKSDKNWNISSFASGIHFLSVQTNKGSKQFKFIKE